MIRRGIRDSANSEKVKELLLKLTKPKKTKSSFDKKKEL